MELYPPLSSATPLFGLTVSGRGGEGAVAGLFIVQRSGGCSGAMMASAAQRSISRSDHITALKGAVHGKQEKDEKEE